METENLSTLKINKLSQAQYDRELAADKIEVDALYLTPDDSDEKYVPRVTDEDVYITSSNNNYLHLKDIDVAMYNSQEIGVNFELSGSPMYPELRLLSWYADSPVSLDYLNNINMRGTLRGVSGIELANRDVDGNEIQTVNIDVEQVYGTDDNIIDTPAVSFYNQENDGTVILRHIADPINDNDAANKAYVDTNINTLDVANKTYVDSNINALSTQVNNLDDELGDLSLTVGSHTATLNSLDNGLTTLSSTVSNHTNSLNTLTSEVDTKLTRYAWSVTHQDSTWMRLCYVTSTALGSSFILNLAHTRGNTVYNDTYIIKAHHSKNGQISKISGSGYTSGLQLRVVSDSSGSCYVDLYDGTGNKTTSAIIYCRLIPISVNTVTTYTSQSGSSIPDGFAQAAILTTNNNPVQYSKINVLSSDYYGTSLPAAGTKGRLFFKVVS